MWGAAYYLSTFVDGGGIIIAALRCDPGHKPSSECHLIDEVGLHLWAAVSVVGVFPGDACGWLALQSLSRSLGTSQGIWSAVLVGDRDIAPAAEETKVVGVIVIRIAVYVVYVECILCSRILCSRNGVADGTGLAVPEHKVAVGPGSCVCAPSAGTHGGLLI